MTFSIFAPARDLSIAAQYASSVINGHSTVPIFGHLHVEVEGGRATLTAAGGDQMFAADIEAEGAGVTTIPATQFAFAVGGVDGSTGVKVDQDGERAKLVAGKFSQVFSTLPADGFPTFIRQDDGISVSLYPDELAQHLTALMGAALKPSLKTGRAYLEGIYFDFAKHCVAATNCHIMFRIDAPWGVFGKKDTVPKNFILPYSACNPLKKLLTGAEIVELKFYNDGNLVEFCRPGFRFLTKTVEAAFADYERMIPATPKNHVQVQASALMTALRRVSRVPTEENFNAVKFSVDKDQITLESKDGNGNYAQDACSAEVVQGEPCSFVVGIEYLSWAIKSFSTDETLVVQIQDDKTPVVVTSSVAGADTKAIRLVGPRAGW